jgi:hypothetical protein
MLLASLSSAHPLWTLLAIQPSWMALFGLSLARHHIRLIARNLTTNEAVNYGKYEYLKDPETGRFRNPYNRGWQSNFLQFFGVEPSSSIARKVPIACPCSSSSFLCVVDADALV